MSTTVQDSPGAVGGAAREADLASPIRGEILWDRAAINQVLPEWQDLADTVSPASFFLRPAVWQSWSRTLANNKPSGLVLVRAGRRLVGAMPVMIRKAWRGPTLGMRYDYDPQDRRWLSHEPRRFIPLRQLSPVLSLPATMLGPILLASPVHKVSVVTAMAQAISTLPGWDMAVLPAEESELALWQSGFARAGLNTDVQRLDRPGFSLTNPAQLREIVATLNRNGRKNFRRATAAADKARITFSISQDAQISMSIVRDLAAQSWKAKGRTDQDFNIPYDGLQGAFFDDLMLGADRSRIVSATATQNGAPIAIVMGVVNGGTLTTLLTYWNGAGQAASPGLLTLGTIIDWAAQNRIDRLDFNSNSPWLRNLADHKEMQQNLLIFAKGAKGRALSTIRSAGLGLKSLRERARNPKPDQAAPS